MVKEGLTSAEIRGKYDNEYFESLLDSGIARPSIEVLPSGYVFKYESEGINVYVRGISKDRAGNLQAECDFTSDRRNDFKELLGQRINLHSFSARKKVADEISKSRIHNENYDTGSGIPFNEIFEDLANRLLKLYREGNSIEESTPLENIEPVKYVIEPFIHEANPTIIFGERGKGKSLLAEFMAIAATLPWYDNPLGLTIPSEKSLKVLYLDYERSKPLFDMRLSQIAKGHNLGFVSLNYMRCWQPFADIADRIETAKNDLGLDLLIVDSLGQATGGNINEPEPAIRYFGALRRLNLPSLTIAQTAKDTLGKRRSVFGSTYFEYYASSIWEAKAENESSELVMSLTNTKCNIAATSERIDIKFSFIPKENEPKVIKEIKVSKTDISKTELASELPIKERTYKLLLQEGKLTSETIAEILGESKSSIESKLYQYKDKLFTKIGHEWGAVAKGYNG